jgi:hypothetical protein
MKTVCILLLVVFCVNADLTPGQSQLLGVWRLVSSDNFDSAMSAMGVGWWFRQTAKIIKPDVSLSVSADNTQWTLKTITSIKSTQIDFKLGVEFDEETADGRDVKSTFSWDKDCLVQIQKEADGGAFVAEIRRQVVVGNGGRMQTLVKAKGGVEAVRVYERTQ